MRSLCCAALLLGASCFFPQAAFAQGPQAAPDCGKRYGDFFPRVESIGLTNPDQFRANAEVKALFGSRPEACEAGGYGKFLSGFSDFARKAMRSPQKQREGMVRTAIAILEVSPLRIPPEEVRSSVTAYRQVRSDLVATATDVKATPLIQSLLDNFERVGTPVPSSAPQVIPDGNVQALRIPTSPLPPWIVVSIFEILELQKQKNHDVAQGKVEAIVKWLETAP